MNQEEKDKENEWLVGSIKRSDNTQEDVFMGIAGLILIVAGVVSYLLGIIPDIHFSSIIQGVWIGGILLVDSFLGIIQHNRIKRASSANELLTCIDRLKKWRWILIVVVIAICILFFFSTGFNFLNNIGLLVGIALLLYQQLGREEDEDIVRLREILKEGYL